MPSDDEVLQHIDALMEEEHVLEHQHEGSGLDGDEVERLHRIQVQLDQLWDLLRQRRARRHAGQDPDVAAPRDPGTVEDYLQ
jgi:hypothetical protein